ncbi:MAG: helicase-exonuclease AddAB subunit AddA [Lachnospiraceae bacterium]|nr:helicase-exonuclease AddAB subunit AddA [Lachnospiraceae bacterium]
MEPTGNQKLAIGIRDCNVLVSAAAGSGKTSVLVERVVRRITDERLDVDRLLIMTFTKAAASELRDRIREAIDKKITELRKKPGCDPEMLSHLEKQSMLVHNASITTIHGFCKSVITDHFDEVSLDPDHRIADENECKLLKADALDECMENAYEKGDESFLEAVECFSGMKGDGGFADLVIPIHSFLTASPDPEEFAKECLAAYEPSSFEEFRDSAIVRKFEGSILKELDRLKEAVLRAKTIIDGHEELNPYRACIEAYIAFFEDTAEDVSKSASVYESVRRALGCADFPGFGRVNTKNLDPEALAAKDAVGSCRDTAKSGIGSLKEKLAFDLNAVYEHILTASGPLKALIGLVLDFDKVYGAKKRDLNVIDYGDMEHMAVRILKNPEIAASYRERFAEIYVDEYQDSNMIQEVLVSLICRHDPGNVFQVGDVKQSIYRFRQARPDLFLSKYNSYSPDERGDDRRILLNDNFRSRREVVDAVNEVFERIMKPDLGGIDYDESKLVYGATCYGDAGDSTYRTELIIGLNDELSAAEMNAAIIAGKISSMIRSGFIVYDKAADTMRPASYRDFTVLVRSIKKMEPVFREVFASAGIPLAVTGREGYFGTLEVSTALSFLSAVDNPFCDIPLAALMRSPVGGFSDTDLARLSVSGQNSKCLYDRVKLAALSGDADLKEKCERIISFLRKYREMSGYTPVHGILADFIDNEYGDYVRCMDKGEQRMANLAMLLSKAEDYGRTNFRGLYQFVRYIDQVRKYQIDDGEAGINSENDDVVRIMTMHGSKGLEFPVCFLAGIEKGRNRRDETGSVIWSISGGFGCSYTDLKNRTKGTTLPKMIVSEENRLDSLAEEMRIFYVAMTRAREKLIMVGCGKQEFSGTAESAERASSYLDMLRSAYGEEGFSHIDIKHVTEEDLVLSRLREHMERESAGDKLLALARKGADIGVSEVPEYLKPLSFMYPYPINPALTAKLSVSELKHRAMKEMEDKSAIVDEGERLFKETDPENYIPVFMRAEGQTATGGTFYGTAFHRILELWDYAAFEGEDVTPADVDVFVERMRSLHHMDGAEADAIRAADVAAFLNCPLGRRMKNAAVEGRLFREQPFVIGADEDGETILVQGIIDAFFTEPDGITVVDYKTDRVDREEMLVNRYRTQLEYYGRALSQITGMRVKALSIYSTRFRKQIDIA